jgi:hypothetical protein
VDIEDGIEKFVKEKRSVFRQFKSFVEKYIEYVEKFKYSDEQTS